MRNPAFANPDYIRSMASYIEKTPTLLYQMIQSFDDHLMSALLNEKILRDRRSKEGVDETLTGQQYESSITSPLGEIIGLIHTCQLPKDQRLIAEQKAAQWVREIQNDLFHAINTTIDQVKGGSLKEPDAGFNAVDQTLGYLQPILQLAHIGLAEQRPDNVNGKPSYSLLTDEKDVERFHQILELYPDVIFALEDTDLVCSRVNELSSALTRALASPNELASLERRDDLMATLALSAIYHLRKMQHEIWDKRLDFNTLFDLYTLSHRGLHENKRLDVDGITAFDFIAEFGNRVIPEDLIPDILEEVIHQGFGEASHQFTENVLTNIWQGKYETSDAIVFAIIESDLFHESDGVDFCQTVLFGNPEHDPNLDADLLPTAWQLEKRMELLGALAQSVNLDEEGIHLDIKKESDRTMLLAMQTGLLFNCEQCKSLEIAPVEHRPKNYSSMIVAAAHTDHILTLRDSIDQRQSSHPALHEFIHYQLNKSMMIDSQLSDNDPLAVTISNSSSSPNPQI